MARDKKEEGEEMLHVHGDLYVAKKVITKIVEVISAGGKEGAQSGAIYMAVMGFGIDIDTFAMVMVVLEFFDEVRREDETYFFGKGLTQRRGEGGIN